MAEQGPVTAARPVPAWRTYWILQSAAWRTAFSHRANIAALVVGSAALQGTQLLFLGVPLAQFGVIGGWSPAEAALLYGMRLTAHGVCTVLLGQHALIDTVIRDGHYDRFLLRPANPFVQLITWRFNPGTLGDVVLGLSVLAVGAGLASVEWSPALISFLVLAVLGGGLVEGGIQVAISALAFALRTAGSVKATVDGVLTDFGAYPMTIFGQGRAIALTFALSLALMAYLPATVLLARTEELFVPGWLAHVAPLAGPLLLASPCRSSSASPAATTARAAGRPRRYRR